MSRNLLMAIYHEHLARTNHDVFSQDTDRVSSLRTSCHVCFFLDAEKRDKQESASCPTCGKKCGTDAWGTPTCLPYAD